MNTLVRCTIRVSRVLFAKFRYVAYYDGRSANKEIEHLMKKRAAEYETAIRQFTGISSPGMLFIRCKKGIYIARLAENRGAFRLSDGI